MDLFGLWTYGENAAWVYFGAKNYFVRPFSSEWNNLESQYKSSLVSQLMSHWSKLSFSSRAFALNLIVPSLQNRKHLFGVTFCLFVTRRSCRESTKNLTTHSLCLAVKPHIPSFLKWNLFTSRCFRCHRPAETCPLLSESAGNTLYQLLFSSYHALLPGLSVSWFQSDNHSLELAHPKLFLPPTWTKSGWVLARPSELLQVHRKLLLQPISDAWSANRGNTGAQIWSASCRNSICST